MEKELVSPNSEIGQRVQQNKCIYCERYIGDPSRVDCVTCRDNEWAAHKLQWGDKYVVMYTDEKTGKRERHSTHSTLEYAQHTVDAIIAAVREARRQRWDAYHGNYYDPRIEEIEMKLQ